MTSSRLAMTVQIRKTMFHICFELLTYFSTCYPGRLHHNEIIITGRLLLQGKLGVILVPGQLWTHICPTLPFCTIPEAELGVALVIVLAVVDEARSFGRCFLAVGCN